MHEHQQTNVQAFGLPGLDAISRTAMHKLAYNQEGAKQSALMELLYVLEATNVTKACIR